MNTENTKYNYIICDTSNMDSHEYLYGLVLSDNEIVKRVGNLELEFLSSDDYVDSEIYNFPTLLETISFLLSKNISRQEIIDNYPILQLIDEDGDNYVFLQKCDIELFFEISKDYIDKVMLFVDASTQATEYVCDIMEKITGSGHSRFSMTYRDSNGTIDGVCKHIKCTAPDNFDYLESYDIHGVNHHDPDEYDEFVQENNPDYKYTCSKNILWDAMMNAILTTGTLSLVMATFDDSLLYHKIYGFIIKISVDEIKDKITIEHGQVKAGNMVDLFKDGGPNLQKYRIFQGPNKEVICGFDLE